ncbi:MAG: AlpA family phage regulatory protein [Hydrogenophaga sp.]
MKMADMDRLDNHESTGVRQGASHIPFDDRLLKLNEVMKRVSYSHDWIYRQIALGRFPRPVKLGRSSRWRLSDVNAWVAGTWKAGTPVGLS